MGFRSPLNGIPPSGITADMLADESVTGSKLSADAIDGKTITGAFIRTAATGKRWELSSAAVNLLRAFSGATGEAAPGALSIDAEDGGGGVDVTYKQPVARLEPPTMTVQYGNPAYFSLTGDNGKNGTPGNGYRASANLGAPRIFFSALGDGEADGFGSANHFLDIIGGTNGGVFVNGTKAIRGVGFGSFSGVADVNGEYLFAHGLGRAPVAAVAISTQTGAARIFHVTATSATNLRVRSYDAAGVAVASGATIAGYFVALA